MTANNDLLTETDASKVKFLSDNNSGPQNGDAKVSLGEVKPFNGMDKQELMKYAKDPFWVRLRWFMFILFWLIWVLMLAGAIVIVVYAPKCPAQPDREWWQKSPVYHIYVKSFKDGGKEDGIGDIKGVETKLDYLKGLGVETIWLSSVQKSSTKDNGHGVDDFTSIDGIFGTMEDFKSLVNAMKEKEMKLIMDFVPNQTSKKHPWFQESKQKYKPYDDYYIWRNSPNNWLSVSGDSAWSKDSVRNQFYYHHYSEDQPELNLYNEKVIDELLQAVEFWLNTGVSGFVVNDADFLYEDSRFLDEPKSSNVNATGYNKLDHIYTTDQPDNYVLLRRFRKFLDNYTATDSDSPRVMFTKSGDSDILQYYGNDTAPIAHFPLNFDFPNLEEEGDINGWALNDTINFLLKNLPENIGWANWMLGGPDRTRIGSVVGDELIDAMNMITMLLPGTPLTYYGEEIGMVDLKASTRKLMYSQRSPMQWDNSTNAGFSEVEPWMRVNKNYETVNVESELKLHTSHLSIYKKLVAMRKQKSCLFGETAFPIVNRDLFCFTRVVKGSPGYIVLVNLGMNTTTVDLNVIKGMSEDVTLRLPENEEGHRTKLKSSAVTVKERSGLVLTYVVT